MSTDAAEALDQRVRHEPPTRRTVARRDPSDWFYFACAWLIAVVVAYGFAQTIWTNLLHAAVPRPLVLWIHAGLSFAWVAFFILQTTLIRARRPAVHRRAGTVGLVLGAAIPIVGTATALAMARFDVAQGLREPAYMAAHLSIPLNDMIAFAAVFGAAAWWRKRPDIHRRLILVATCLLTAAAFARFPFITITVLRWYGGVDLLLLMAVAHDLLTIRRIHVAHALVVPLVVVGQVIAMALFLGRPNWWVSIASQLIG